MKLTEVFNSNKQIEGSGKAQQAFTNNAIINRQIHALKPGQTLQGELVARNGCEVQIKVAEDFLIKARVEQNLNLDIGKLMAFEVKNNGTTLTLLPLYTNTATDANVLKALDMASLPITAETITMTEQMMQSGLSIDRNSLQQIFRESNIYHENDIGDIIDLHKLSLPVNEENLAQITSYKNLTHQLSSGLNNVIDIMPDTVHNMVQSGHIDGAAKLFLDILNLIAPEYSDNVQQGNMQQGNVQQGNMQQEDVVFAEETLQSVVDAHTAEGLLKSEDMIQTIGGKLFTESADGNTAMRLLQHLLHQGINDKDTALLQNILENKEISNYVKEIFRQLWSVTPQEVADEGQVEKLYHRLDKQLKGLAQVLESANQTNTEAYKATVNMTNNLDFLQQINQTYTYLQLPLRLQQGNNAHGDLYVYSNKKHMASSDGKITALLHLDMEHLGSLDVYVAMQNETVSTKFYVQDEILDFLEANMDMLTQRLRKRGYNCNCEMVTREAEYDNNVNVIQKLLGKEPQIPIVQYSFDVRT